MVLLPNVILNVVKDPLIMENCISIGFFAAFRMTSRVKTTFSNSPNICQKQQIITSF